MSISPRRYFKLNEGVMWISSIQPTQTQKNFRFGNNASYLGIVTIEFFNENERIDLFSLKSLAH